MKRIKRVVITGLGVVAPTGIGKEAFWAACIAGRSGIRTITRFDASQLPTRIAGEVPDFDPSLLSLTSGEVQLLDRGTQFALAAAHLAIEDSGLLPTLQETQRERTGVFMGAAMSPGDEGEKMWIHFTGKGAHPPRLDNDAIDNAQSSATLLLSFAPANVIATRFSLHGPCAVFATGCSAGSDAIGQAYWAISQGQADTMLAGGSDSAINASGINVFSVMKALSTRNDAPEQASRPYDGQRDGFVMAEGAGVLVLEEREAALARHAHIYAEIIGFVSNTNAYHMTALPEDGQPLQALLRQAIEETGIEPERIGYINSHGSSTLFNERAETSAYKAVFGAQAYAIPISATKSMIGHTQGAASAIETIVTALALDHQHIPPTINQHYPDPHCDLDYVPNVARRATFDIALTHSSGFGGVNSALVLARASYPSSPPSVGAGDVEGLGGDACVARAGEHDTPAGEYDLSAGDTEITLRATQASPPNPTPPPPLRTTTQPPRRVVVTGLGIIAPNGNGKEAFWHAISNGVSGIEPVRRFSPLELPVQVAGEASDFEVERYLERKLANRTDRMTHLALAAAQEAIADARLIIEQEQPQRVGVVVANTMGGLDYVIHQIEALHVRGPRAMSAYTAIAWLQVANAGQIALRYGLQGYCKAPVNDLVGGLDALGIAYRAIQRGAADVIIGGGCEALLHPCMLLVLAQSGICAPGNDPRAYRPFDRRASGLILAEGAGICIMEEYEHAIRRGAPIYGELVGYAQTNDAHSLHVSPVNGSRYARAISSAMKEAGLSVADIGYFSLDGRATRDADAAEADALYRAFGPDLDTLPVSVPRSMLGHSFAAAGAIDTVTALLSLRHGAIPPTINCEQLDPHHRLRPIREPGTPLPSQAILLGGRSLNGSNSVLAIKKVEI